MRKCRRAWKIRKKIAMRMARPARMSQMPRLSGTCAGSTKRMAAIQALREWWICSAAQMPHRNASES